ncbi:hypothetical protein [Microbacterium sp.]|uniref:hypothetical protein n=1 Tax=Microbacterium sp. TaxID=51671 RepID=UPI00289D3E6F|nr:hypothetical protein [Microbacterium sp.]
MNIAAGYVRSPFAEKLEHHSNDYQRLEHDLMTPDGTCVRLRIGTPLRASRFGSGWLVEVRPRGAI